MEHMPSSIKWNYNHLTKSLEFRNFFIFSLFRSSAWLPSVFLLYGKIIILITSYQYRHYFEVPSNSFMKFNFFPILSHSFSYSVFLPPSHPIGQLYIYIHLCLPSYTHASCVTCPRIYQLPMNAYAQTFTYRNKQMVLI